MKVIQERKARATGTTVQVIDNRDRSFMDDAGRWYTVCDTHGTLCSHDTRRLAVWHAPAPDGWCDECCALVGGDA